VIEADSPAVSSIDPRRADRNRQVARCKSVRVRQLDLPRRHRNPSTQEELGTWWDLLHLSGIAAA
jgi:hypothetical protein